MSDVPPGARRVDNSEFLLQELIANVSLMRTNVLRQFLDPRRDIDDECGFPKTAVPPQTYKDLVDRDAIACRIVEFMAKEAWCVWPELSEDPDEDKVTPFEEDWEALPGQLMGGDYNWFAADQGNLLRDYMLRWDIASKIGKYGVLLLGFDDTDDLRLPVAGLEEYNSASLYVQTDKDKPLRSPEQVTGLYSLNAAKAKPKARKLLYLRVFPETLAQITQIENNPTSPRYGQPKMYLLSYADINDTAFGNYSMQATREVHWSRVVHLPATDVQTCEWIGREELRPVYNNIYSLRKLYGASAEGYWKSCFAGLSIETHPSLGGDVNVDREGLKNMMEDFQNGLQRALFLMGMTAKSIAPSVVDPTPHVNTQLEAIAINKGVPVRILKGSERGELSSEQDAGEWDGRVRTYQELRCTARQLIPFVNRLIMVGVLRAPTKPLNCDWPDISAPSVTEKAQVAATLTATIAQYVAGGLDALIPPLEFLSNVMGDFFTKEEAQAIIDAAISYAEEQLEAGVGAAPPGSDADGAAENPFDAGSGGEDAEDPEAPPGDGGEGEDG